MVNAFQQRICGFDLLRTEKGRVVVCDVNGWSFVKSRWESNECDDEAASVRDHMMHYQAGVQGLPGWSTGFTRLEYRVE